MSFLFCKGGGKEFGPLEYQFVDQVDGERKAETKSDPEEPVVVGGGYEVRELFDEMEGPDIGEGRKC